MLAIAIAAVSLTRTSAGAAPPVQPGIAVAQRLIPRFLQVDDRLFRGGQPDRKGLEALSALGVHTIVNLRAEHDERHLVEQLGLKYVHIPIGPSPFGVAIRFPESALRKFFDVVDDPGSGRVFVHCLRGADRTGVLVGAYRITRERWDADAAYREARQIGMRWWYRGFRAQLYELAAPEGARLSASALLPLRQAE